MKIPESDFKKISDENYEYETSGDNYFLLKWSNKLEVGNVDLFTVDDNVKRNS